MAGADMKKEGSMEGEIGRAESGGFPIRKAPYPTKSRRRSCVILDKDTDRPKIPQLNGKQLKISVVKLNGQDIGKPSVVSLLGKTDNANGSRQKDAKRNGKHGGRRSKIKDRISNNNTIKDRSESSLSGVTENLIDNSLSKLCSDCGSCADSPQSIISEDTSSQASDSLFVKVESTQQDSKNTGVPCKKTEESQPSPSNICKWANCTNSQVDLSQLQEHIINTHIQSQTSSGSYVCMWTGCKVYNKPSLSKSWLERHILHHSGGKPFRCIIDGCRSMFSSRFLQERHVRSHFETYQNQSGKAGKDSSSGSPSKINRKRKLKKKVVRPIKTEDSFDAYVMEKIKTQLLYKDTMPADQSASSATFRSTVIAKRLEPNGTTSVLLHWNPPNLKMDEWVSADKVTEGVCMPHKSVPQTSQPKLSAYTSHRFRKHRRK